MTTLISKLKKIFVEQDIIRLIKFGIVGGSGVVVNMFFLWLFKEIAGLYYLFASALAITLAMTNNFIWNDLWTWKGRGQKGIKAYLIRYLKFCFISGLADYVGNLSLLWFFTQIMHIYYLISNLIAIAIVMVFKFIIHDRWTFRQKKSN